MNVILAGVCAVLIIALTWTLIKIIEWMVDTNKGPLFMVVWGWVCVTGLVYILMFGG